MAERPGSSLAKHATSIAKPVTKQIGNTVKTVAKEARRGGDLGPKAAAGAAKSIGKAGGTSAKAAVSGGLSALKQVGGQVLGKNGNDKKGEGGSAKTKVTNIIEEIDVGAPRRLVYDQWTRFQDFPSFMKKVESTDQLADEKVRWKAKILWSTRTWESTIVEQVPDERIVWRSTGQKGYVDGAVTFHELAPDLTRVLLVLEYHPQGFMEKTGNLWRAQGRRARLELKHFRRHVMSQALLHPGDEAEGWHGEIHDGEVAESSKSDGQGGSKSRRTSSQSGRSTRSRTSSSTARSSGDKTSSAKSSDEKSSSARSSGEKSSSAKSSGDKASSAKSSGSSSARSSSGGSSGTRRSSNAKKSSASGRSSGGSSSSTRRSAAKETAGAKDE
ncbi:SRPBCC family protein [Actinoallomurus rhizosphaericola]|uniref:SRPBCC family protein n=1 Tax=Actinoallomurus rhizosphaericola TaxID=2952536 RepID=UPI0020934433|nr:SRPBCC family protein [Actinoallomurus rhizosphaericola]MCO5999758.1 SRPBCC family protein [Actinoallomurus rhizosphaericola]